MVSWVIKSFLSKNDLQAVEWTGDQKALGNLLNHPKIQTMFSNPSFWIPPLLILRSGITLLPEENYLVTKKHLLEQYFAQVSDQSEPNGVTD